MMPARADSVYVSVKSVASCNARFRSVIVSLPPKDGVADNAHSAVLNRHRSMRRRSRAWSSRR